MKDDEEYRNGDRQELDYDLLKKGTTKEKITYLINFGIREYDDARIMQNACSATLFTLISLFPLLMLVIAFVPAMNVSLEDILELVRAVVPETMVRMMSDLFTNIYHNTVGGTTISVNVLILLWSASSGVNSVSRGINDAFRTTRKRAWVIRRAYSVLYTLVFILVIAAFILSFVLNHTAFRGFLQSVPGFANFRWLFRLLMSWVAVILAILLFMVIYQVFPHNKTFFLHQFPGALVAGLGVYIFSLIFSNYLKTVVYYSYVYGALASLASMAIWLLVCMNFIFAGAEINYLWINYYIKWRDHKDLEKTIERLEKEEAGTAEEAAQKAAESRKDRRLARMRARSERSMKRVPLSVRLRNFFHPDRTEQNLSRMVKRELRAQNRAEKKERRRRQKAAAQAKKAEQRQARKEARAARKREKHGRIGEQGSSGSGGKETPADGEGK